MEAALVTLALVIYPLVALNQPKLYVLVGAGVGALYVASYAQTGRVPVGNLRLAWPVYAFWVMITASVAWSVAPRATLLGALAPSASFVEHHEGRCSARVGMCVCHDSCALWVRAGDVG